TARSATAEGATVSAPTPVVKVQDTGVVRPTPAVSLASTVTLKVICDASSEAGTNCAPAPAALAVPVTGGLKVKLSVAGSTARLKTTAMPVLGGTLVDPCAG